MNTFKLDFALCHRYRHNVSKQIIMATNPTKFCQKLVLKKSPVYGHLNMISLKTSSTSKNGTCLSPLCHHLFNIKIFYKLFSSFLTVLSLPLYFENTLQNSDCSTLTFVKGLNFAYCKKKKIFLNSKFCDCPFDLSFFLQSILV